MDIRIKFKSLTNELPMEKYTDFTNNRYFVLKDVEWFEILSVDKPKTEKVE